MRPTRRNLVALGRTCDSAHFTSSMRGLEFGMPSVWLPDIEPDASNTIIASSVQGFGFLSSGMAGPANASMAAAASAKTLRPLASATFRGRDGKPIAELQSQDFAYLARNTDGLGRADLHGFRGRSTLQTRH